MNEKATLPITEQEYIVALRIVEQYHKQIGLFVKLLPSDKLLGDCNLSIRTHNCLKGNDMNFSKMTLFDLSKYSVSELMEFRNFGKSSLQELVNLLAGAGLKFK